MIKFAEDRKTLLLLLAVLSFSFLAFLPCLKNGFVNWDDNWYFTDNSAVKSLSMRNTARIFGSFLADRYTYQPLTILCYSIEYHFFRAQPAGYHLVGVILHLLNTALVFWLVCILSKRRFIACVVAILFGVHPIHVEPVAWISARKDLLCALFFFSSLIAYAYYLRLSRSVRYYILSLAFFLAALLSKAMAITLPLVLFLLDGLLVPDSKKISLKGKMPFFALSFVFAGIVAFGFFSAAAAGKGAVFGLFDKFFISNFIILFYISKILVPTALSCCYADMVIPGQPLPPLFFVSVLFLLSIAWAVFLLRDRSRHIVFGALFFIITILPVLQLVPTGRSLVADRYLYIPSVGIFYLAAEALFLFYYGKKTEVADRIIKIIFSVGLAVIIIVLGILTRQRCGVWKDDIALWSDALAGDPRSATAYNNLGVFFAQNGDKDKAMVLFKRAIHMDKRNFRAYNNLGMAYSDAGLSQDAIACFKSSIALNPRFVAGFLNLCREYTKTGKLDDALATCSLAVRLDPDCAQAHNSLGAVYYSLGKTGEALRLFEKARDIDPSCETALHNLEALRSLQPPDS